MIKKLSCFIWTKANFRIASHTPQGKLKKSFIPEASPKTQPLTLLYSFGRKGTL